MKFWVYGLLLLVLSGCQAPSMPSGIRPIDAPITLGNAPVVDAAVIQRETIVGYKQGQSGSITVDSEIRVDVQRAGKCLYLRSHVLTVESSFSNIIEAFINIYRKRFALRIGQVISYEADLETAKVTARQAHGTSSAPGPAATALLYNVLLEQLHLGGETVTQGQELLRYRLGDLVPGVVKKDDADLAYSLRVVGRAVVEGRAVIVTRAAGHIWGNDSPLAIDAVVYFDERTGVALHSDTSLHHIRGEDGNTRIRIVRDLSFDGAVDAKSPQHPSPIGKCQADI